jgi:hypothetical protein
MSSTKFTLPPANETSTLQPPQSVKVAWFLEEFFRKPPRKASPQKASPNQIRAYEAGYNLVYNRLDISPSEVLAPSSFDSNMRQRYNDSPTFFKLGIRAGITRELINAFGDGYSSGYHFPLQKYPNYLHLKGFMLDVAEKGRRYGTNDGQFGYRTYDSETRFNYAITPQYIDSVVNYLLQKIPLLRSSSQKETTMGTVAERKKQEIGVKNARVDGKKSGLSL